MPADHWMHGRTAGRKPTHGRYAKPTIEQQRTNRALISLVMAWVED
jgi:hypothetical protein